MEKIDREIQRHGNAFKFYMTDHTTGELEDALNTIADWINTCTDDQQFDGNLVNVRWFHRHLTGDDDDGQRIRTT